MNSPDAAPPETSPAGDVAGATLSRDLFYRGRFELLQPKNAGFRAGLDALLLAASLPADLTGRAADLGAGAGAAAFASACRCPGLDLVLVEKDAGMADLSRASLALGGNAAFAQRLSIVRADVLARRGAREALGLADESFSAVITNPPFHPDTGRGSPDAKRLAARTMPDGGFLGDWLRCAAALLERRGLLAMIVRPDNLVAVLDAARGRLGDIRVMPVHPRPDRRASRILVQARKGSRAGLSLLPPIVLHGLDGALTPLGAAIGEGTADLDFGLGG